MSPTFLRPIRDRLARYFAQRPPSSHVLLWLLRGCFGAIVIGMAMIAFRHFSEGPGDPSNGYLAFLCILGAGLLIVVTDVLIRNKQITTISAIYFGLLLGLLLGNILSTALEPFVFDWGSPQPMPGPNARLVVHPDKDGAFHVEVSPTDAGGTGTPEQRGRYQRKALSLIITVVCCYICHLHAAADQGRIPLHHPLRGILQAGQGRQAAGPGHQCHHRRPNCRYL